MGSGLQHQAGAGPPRCRGSATPWLACPYGGGGTQCKGLLSQQMASGSAITDRGSHPSGSHGSVQGHPPGGFRQHRGSSVPKPPNPRHIPLVLLVFAQGFLETPPRRPVPQLFFSSPAGPGPRERQPKVNKDTPARQTQTDRPTPTQKQGLASSS